MIYADNAATTRMSEGAIRTMTTMLNEVWGNPSSLYEHGQKAKEVLEQARADIAAVIGAAPAGGRPTTRPSALPRSSERKRERRTSSPPRLSITRSFIRWRS